MEGLALRDAAVPVSAPPMIVAIYARNSTEQNGEGERVRDQHAPRYVEGGAERTIGVIGGGGR
jgi:hypothetical protein